MHRRELLLSAGAAVIAATTVSVAQGEQPAAAGPATGTAQPPTPASKRTLRKAVMIGMVGGPSDLTEKFKLLRSCGFEGVEMDSPTPISMDEIKKARDATGIVVHGMVDSVHWKWHLNNPDATVRQKGVDALKQALRDAASVGASSVLLVPAVVNGQMAYDAAYTLSQQAIRECLPVAEETKVQIAIENVWNNFLLSPLEAAKYVDDFNHPLVKFHFDIGNVINTGWPAQWIRILGNRIVKLHIKDFSKKKRDDEGLWKGFNVELGDGDAVWPAVMKELDALGYSTAPGGNWATAEVGGGSEDRLRQISAQMDRLFTL
jgi:hexulose-6-phosphate isomerase